MHSKQKLIQSTRREKMTDNLKDKVIKYTKEGAKVGACMGLSTLAGAHIIDLGTDLEHFRGLINDGGYEGYIAVMIGYELVATGVGTGVGNLYGRIKNYWGKNEKITSKTTSLNII